MKIVKVNKDSLVPMSSVSLDDKDPSSFRTITNGNVVKLCVYHVYDSLIKNEFELQFTIEAVDSHVPFIKDEEYATVVRKKITIDNKSLYSSDFSKFSLSLINPKNNSLPMGIEELKGAD